MRSTIRFATAAVMIAGMVASACSAEHTMDTLDAVKMSMNDGKAVLLDVREKFEWDDGHLQQARLLPLSTLKAGVAPEDVAKVVARGKIVYLHCGSGIRCLTAADALKKLGYDVRPLKQGYRALVEAGFPAAK